MIEPQINGTLPSFDSKAILEQVDRMVLSHAFGHSGRQKRLLKFLVMQALTGKKDSLNEATVAIEFFGRGGGYDSRTDPVVRVEVRRLRHRLESYYKSEGQNDHVFISIPKGGYVPAFDLRDRVEPSGPALSPRLDFGAKHLLHSWAMAGGLMFLLTLLALSWRFSGGAQTPPRSVAVLPFVSLAPDTESQYFTEGLSDALSDGLGKVEGLRVVAWTSALQFQGKNEDRRIIGRRLDVEAVIEGSVQRRDGHVRVIARLDRTKDGAELWSDTFEGNSQDLLTLQWQIAHSIAGALRTKLNGSAAAHEAHGPQSEAAYQSYLTGRYLWNRCTTGSVHKSIPYFRQAIQQDPQYALAYAGLADSLAILPEFDVVDPSVVAEGKQAALKALQLVPSLAEAKLVLALIAFEYDWDWTAAQRGFQEVIAENPNNAQARRRYARALISHGRFPEAEEQLGVARRLDPLSHGVRINQAELAYYRRDFVAEERVLREILDIDPWYSLARIMLWKSLLFQRRFLEAEAELRAIPTLPEGAPQFSDVLWGRFHAFIGKREEARAELEPSLVRNEPTAAMAENWILLGEKARAIAALDGAFRRHSTTLMDLNVDPMWDLVRDDHRVQVMLRKLGLLPD